MDWILKTERICLWSSAPCRKSPCLVRTQTDFGLQLCHFRPPASVGRTRTLCLFLPPAKYSSFSPVVLFKCLIMLMPKFPPLGITALLCFDWIRSLAPAGITCGVISVDNIIDTTHGWESSAGWTGNGNPIHELHSHNRY